MSQEVKTSSNEETETIKIRKRGRLLGQVGFPRRPLKKVLTIAEAIEKDNAGEPYDPIILSTKSLNVSHRSSGFEILLAASEKYGLTKGNSRAKIIQLTPLGSAIVAPTNESDRGDLLRQSLLEPKIFERVYSKYDRKNIPREEIFKNILIKEFNIPRLDVDSCYDIIMKNISDYGLTVKSGDSEILYLSNLGNENLHGKSAQETILEEPPQGEKTEEVIEDPKQEIIVKQIPRAFISHSENQTILDQIKDMLDFGGFEYKIAEEEETPAIPIPEKVFTLMRQCNCAIINVSADEENKQEDENYKINENVLIEIGGAFVHYDKRVILLVDKRITLPTNLEGLYRCEYEGDELSWNVAMKLQKTLTEFRKSI